MNYRNITENIQKEKKDEIFKKASEFFEKDYPLIKLFEYGDDFLIYDAKPNFAFIVTEKETNALIDFLIGKSRNDIFIKYISDIPNIKNLVNKYHDLKDCGVFLKGPLKEISPIDYNKVRTLVEYYKENIVLRKFCLEVTQDCNFRCKYCQNTIETKTRKHTTVYMDEKTAYAGVAYYFDNYIRLYSKLSKDKKKKLLELAEPTLSWYGGEPFLNFNIVKKSKEYFENLPWEKYGIKKSSLRYTINSNLSIINEEILNFLVSNEVILFASIDGPESEHDKNRIDKFGNATFKNVYKNLLRIKENNPEYFSEKVVINAVKADNYNYELCNVFLESLNASSINNINVSYTNIFAPKAKLRIKYLQDNYQNIVTKFEKEIYEKDSVLLNNSYIYRLFEKLIVFDTIVYDNPVGYNLINILLTCPMGFDNLMLDANGNYQICHKTDCSFPIGNVSSGLDTERIIQMYQKYDNIINNTECLNCWNIRFCKICAAERLYDNSFINPSKIECDYFRLSSEIDLDCFISLNIKNKLLWGKVIDYKKKSKNFRSIIDINKL